MARPIIEGLEYISIDVDIFDDVKLLFVSDRFEEKGELVAIKLLLWIYKHGYYINWNDEISLLFAKKNFRNISSSLVNDVVKELVKRDFFAEDMFNRFKILTSKGIQKRWHDIITSAKRKCSINDHYNLLVPKIREETAAKPEETTAKTEETLSEQEETTQSKVKERKVKESNRAKALVVGDDAGKHKQDLKIEYKKILSELNGKDRVVIWNSLKSFVHDNKPDFPEPVVDVWNVFASTYKLSEVRDISDSRRKKFSTRLQESSFDFLKILEKIKVSSHLKGDNQRAWKVTFDWIIENDKNYLKILEGNYD